MLDGADGTGYGPSGQIWGHDGNGTEEGRSWDAGYHARSKGMGMGTAVLHGGMEGWMSGTVQYMYLLSRSDAIALEVQGGIVHTIVHYLHQSPGTAGY